MLQYDIYGLYLSFYKGNKDADEVLKILLGNPNMFGGVLACILDNTVPGKCRCKSDDVIFKYLYCYQLVLHDGLNYNNKVNFNDVA